MYGFHKSRKDPSKNIFSHPFFLRSQPHLLPLVRRKIKNEERVDEEPRPNIPRKKNNENQEPLELSSKKSIQSFSMINEMPKQEKEPASTKT
jgi:hypothetical protein